MNHINLYNLYHEINIRYSILRKKIKTTICDNHNLYKNWKKLIILYYYEKI